jgi:FkbM family methyltransferase
VETRIQRFIRHSKHRLIYKLGGVPAQKIPPGPRTTEDAFKTLVRLEVPIQTIIDVGASNGCWSLLAKKYFPSSRFHLIEAQKCHLDALNTLCGSDPAFSFTLAAASNTAGNVYFDSSGGPYAGIASHRPTQGRNRNALTPCTSIDHEIDRQNLSGPFLIKLDTHGFELPILEGAAETLTQSQALFIECYNFHPGESGMAFWTFCSFLEEKGFRPFDMVQFLHRKRDGFFWQADILFLRADRPEFQDRGW